MADARPQFSERYTDELDSLANMIDAVEDEDFDVVMQLIEQRKDKLMSELTISMFEDVPNMNAATSMAKLKLTDDSDANKAQEAYNKKLVAFYDALPAGEDDKPGDYQIKVMKAAKALAKAWTAYSEKIGEEKTKDIKLMDPQTFNEYFAKAEKAHKAAVEAAEKKKKEEEEAAEKKKEEEEAANKKKEEEENKKKEEELMIFADTDKNKDKEVDPKEDGFAELQELKKAGVEFEMLIHWSAKNLAKDEFTRSKEYFPYKDTKTDLQGWKKYITEAEEKIDAKPLEESYKAFMELQEKFGEFIMGNEALSALFANEYFRDYYFPALVLKGEMPKIDGIKKAAEEDKEKLNPMVQEAYTILKDLKDEDRKKFNEEWKKLMDQVKAMGGEAKKLDESVTKYTKAYDGDKKASNRLA